MTDTQGSYSLAELDERLREEIETTDADLQARLRSEILRDGEAWIDASPPGVINPALVGAALFGRATVTELVAAGCVPRDATLSQRIEAAAALLCLDDPTHLVDALRDAGLEVSAPVAVAVQAPIAPAPDEEERLG